MPAERVERKKNGFRRGKGEGDSTCEEDDDGVKRKRELRGGDIAWN